MGDMGMLVNVVEDEEVFCLGLYYQPSVCVGVVDKPDRRHGVEITTQYNVGCV